MNQSTLTETLSIQSFDIAILTTRIERYDVLLIAARSYPYRLMGRLKSKQNKVKVILSDLKSQFNETLSKIRYRHVDLSNSYDHDIIRLELLNWYGITLELFNSKNRKREAVLSRQLMSCCDKVFTSMSLREIGDNNGNKDHSTILHSIKGIRNVLNSKDKVSLNLINFCLSQKVVFRGVNLTIFEHLNGKL